MARLDGKSVHVTLSADRKTPSFAFAEDGVFLCFRTKKNFGFTIFRFYSFFKETNIGFYSFLQQINIRFYSFLVDKYKKTEYNIGNKI